MTPINDTPRAIMLENSAARLNRKSMTENSRTRLLVQLRDYHQQHADAWRKNHKLWPWDANFQRECRMNIRLHERFAVAVQASLPEPF